MIFLYTTQVDPPAPFMLIDAGEPGCSTYSVLQAPAQVDSAADRTVFPEKVIEQMQLTSSGSASFAGLGGNQVSMSLYSVEILIRTLRPRIIEIATHSQEGFILLGRDFLNQFKIVHDGPRKRLKIEES